MKRTQASTTILLAALPVAERLGYQNVKLSDVAGAIGRTVPLVNRYFTADELRARLLQAAIASRNLRIIGQAIAVADPAVANLSDELRRAAVESLLEK